MNRPEGHMVAVEAWWRVPQEIRSRAQWVVWRYELSPRGDTTKVPYKARATGYTLASSTDPTTWSTFGAAVTVAEARGYDGIGYVMARSDPYVGIDLDHCRSRDTTELEPWALHIVERFSSYTEVTPSGEGLRIFVRAQWPLEEAKQGRRKAGIEIYAGEHFLTVTGDHLEGTPLEIGERTDELRDLYDALFARQPDTRRLQSHPRGPTPPLHDDEVITLLQRSEKQRAKFGALWGGSTTGYDSHSEADLALCNLLGFYTQDESQIERLLFRSGLYREKWERRADYRQDTIRKALEGRTDFYHPPSQYILRGPGERASTPPAATSSPTTPAPQPQSQAAQEDEQTRLTDLGNATRLRRRYQDAVRFCHPWQKWLVWDGKRWAVDQTAEISRLAVETVKAIYREAAEQIDEGSRQAYAKHAIKSESAASLRNMVALAAAQPGIPVLPDQLDRDQWLLCVDNGTLDLRTGELHPHSREDLITKLAPVSYDPDAKCPAWTATLDRIMAHNDHLLGFLQRAAGYSLSGIVSERVLFLLYGTGANGKSTFLETLRAMLGEYALRTPTETLMLKRDQGVRDDVARLRSARLVTASETDEGKRLAESLIKDITGGDTVAARFLYGSLFEFRPECKIWLSTNHKPVIRGADKGIWDRIRLIPFEVRIPDDEQDKQLGRKLQAELPGILTWAVQGCLQWQQEGLSIPQEVMSATEAYHQEMDVIGPFLDECCETSPLAYETSKDLYVAYSNWCEANGERSLGTHIFAQRLEEKGFGRRKGSAGARLWVGVKIKSQ